MTLYCGCREMNRRSFLRTSGAVAILAATDVAGSESTAHAAALTQQARDALTPGEVISRMLAGNERFAAGNQKPRDFLAEQRASAAGQYPAAIALTCVDSRAPVEVICDLGIGDAFNARVAGNIVNDDILGSMEFACMVAGAKLVLVMGHTACGAVKGAIDDVVLGNLTGLVAKIRPAIRETAYKGQRTSANPEFVDQVARTNVTMAVKQIRERSPILREMETSGKIKVVGSMYDLATAKVTLV
ncbi:carbonic anhydrase family protein [Pseudorhodoplanes sp.]|uniref:carbonic anhydrase family protein n=1 Tax=Pseudorhodoplanes sp. TaxID=1934341 RepID=UPI003D131C94